MFGLGWIELLIIGGAISLLAGPVMLRKIMKGAQDLQKMKSDLTPGPRMLQRLMTDDDEPLEEEAEEER